MAKRKTQDDELYDLIGFAPDLPTDAPGACQSMSNVIPTPRGWRSAPDELPGTLYAMPTFNFPILRAHHRPSSSGGVLLTVPATVDNNTAADTTSASQIYAGLSAFVSPTVYTVTGGATVYGGWRNAEMPIFADFGNYLLVKPVGTLHASLGGANTLAPVAGAPSFGLSSMVVANRFVLAFDFLYGWYCCARDDHTSWTVNPATLAASGSLPATGESNRAAVSLGDDVLLFKGNDVWLGRFEPGNAEVWVFDQLRLNVTSMHGHRVVARYRQGAVFLSDEGLFYYDGANLTNLMDQRMQRWFSARVSEQVYRNSVIVDQARDLIWISVVMFEDDDSPTVPSGMVGNKWLFVCDPKTRRWARYNRKEYLDIFEGALLYPGNFSLGQGYQGNNLRTVWGCPATAPFTPRPLSLPATANAVSQIVTNDFGHHFGDVELTRANLKFIVAPTGTAPIATGLYRNNLDDSLVTATPIPRSDDGHFDVRQQARWHRLQFDLYGDWELAGYAVDAGISGVR